MYFKLLFLPLFLVIGLSFWTHTQELNALQECDQIAIVYQTEFFNNEECAVVDLSSLPALRSSDIIYKPVFTGPAITPRGVVLHWTAGNPNATVDEFIEAIRSNSPLNNPTSKCPEQGCAVQLYIDGSGNVYQLVENLATRTAHALGANECCIGIEIAGRGESDLVNNPVQLQAVIKTVAYLVQQYNIPLVNDFGNQVGVLSHHQLSPGEKTDVGDLYLNMVLQPLVSGTVINEDPETSGPPAPELPPPKECLGTQLNPSGDLQQVINSSGSNAFCMNPGIYRGQSIQPKDNQVFVGQEGVVLDGQGSLQAAFSGEANGVYIQGVEIKNYGNVSNPLSDGAIDMVSDSGSMGSAWTLRDLHIHSNSSSGVVLGPSSRALNVRSINNQGFGLISNGEQIVLKGGEFASNGSTNPALSGGVRLQYAKNSVVSSIWTHDNNGVGIWCDQSCRSITIENSVSSADSFAGIAYETSYSATVVNNKIFDTRGDISNPGHAGISISTSQDVLVEGNCVESAVNGIVLIDDPSRDVERNSVPITYRESLAYAGKDNIVRNNVIIYSGKTGAVSKGTNQRIFNTVWSLNDYLDPQFWHKGRVLGFSQWKNISGHSSENLLTNVVGCN